MVLHVRTDCVPGTVLTATQTVQNKKVLVRDTSVSQTGAVVSKQQAPVTNSRQLCKQEYELPCRQPLNTARCYGTSPH